MENRSHALAAGLFVIILGAALVATAFWFGKGEGKSLVPYLASAPGDVSGLKPEAPVRYRGVDVGRVQSIRLDPVNRGNVEIRIGVDPITPVTAATFARLGYLGVTGITFVSLQDSAAGSELLVSSHDKPAVIPMRPSLMDSGENLLGSVGELVERASALLNEDNRGRAARLLGNAEQAAERIGQLAGRLEPAARELPALVSDARGMMGAVKTAAGRVDELGGTVKQLGGTLNALALKVDTRLDTLTDMAAEMATTLTDNTEEVGATARVIQDETIPRLNALADGLTRQTRSIDRVVQTLTEQPQSLVFGNAPPRPGPGETGYSAGTGSSQ